MKAMVMDYVNGTITVSSAFMKRATVVGTAEYAQYQEVRTVYKDFRLIVRQFKTNTKQDRYKGLTYEKMREYIEKHEREDSRDMALKRFDYMVANSKFHSNRFRYPTIKAWFLKRYPDVDTLGLSEEEYNELVKTEKDKEKNPSSDNVTQFPATGTDG